jgi:hypothetical protein
VAEHAHPPPAEQIEPFRTEDVDAGRNHTGIIRRRYVAVNRLSCGGPLLRATAAMPQ